MRIILYTGKGGVGKTTMSVATAIASARRGRRTIVVSTDASRSLSDSLGMEVGDHPVSVTENLFAEQISVHKELKANWGKIQSYISDFLRAQGYADYMAEELAVFPGMEELFSLLKLKDYEESGLYDVAVVDCAPTGSTLKLLSFADVFQWYMERIFNIQRRVVRTIRPIAERIIKAPLPSDDVYKNIEALYGRLMAMRELLSDPTRASMRIVANPEKMVIEESRRTYTYLNLFGYPVDLLIANRILPQEAGGDYFREWMKSQKKYLQQMRKVFAPLPMIEVRLFEGERAGLASLTKMAEEVFGDQDPTAIFYNDKPMEISREGGAYVITIKLPFAEKEDIDLWVKDDELIVSVKDAQRNILLPRVMAGHKLRRAGFENGKFRMEFVPSSEEDRAPGKGD